MTKPPAIDVTVKRSVGGWIADVRVGQEGSQTQHEVAVSEADLVRYGGEDPADLVRRSFEFLLDREPATSILRRFELSDIQRYFPEFGRQRL